MSTAAPLTQREVTERLSVREFLILCRSVDEKYGKKIGELTQLGMQSSHSGNKFKVKGRVIGGVKFDVLDIQRKGAKLAVIVDLEQELGLLCVNYE